MRQSFRALALANFLLSCNMGLRGTVQEYPPEAVRRRVGLYQHNTLEAQPAPGAPIAPPDGVERVRSRNSSSSNRIEPTALLIVVKFFAWQEKKSHK
uniref:Secreted protein n=1 Tax=Anopheles quadriannulatus TaxID=34691 RepID=A0A182XNJ4_ANOQN